MNNLEKSKLQKKVLSHISSTASGRLLLAPRSGKTKIAIDIIKRDKPKSILWVTPSKELAKIDIPREFELWGAKMYLKVLTTSTWKSLSKVSGEFDLIILDEEHYMTKTNSKGLLNKSISGRIISMTGTPTQHFGKIQLYRRLNLEVLYNLSISDATDLGLLSDYSIKVLKVKMSTENNIKAGSKTKSFFTSEFKQYQWLDKSVEKATSKEFRILARMKAIKDSKSKLAAAKDLLKIMKGRTLLFCSNVNQAEALCEHTYHSKTDATDYNKFQSNEIDTIAMVNTGGTGYTYKNLDNLVVVQVDSDKNGMTSQKISRALLSQENYKATLWIVCLLGTQDEKWVESVLDNFDRNKIEYLEYDY